MTTPPTPKPTLILKPLGINTYKEDVVYMREDCHVCRSEGFEAPARINVIHKNGTLLATLNTIQSDLLQPHEASLSQVAWDALKACPGDEVSFAHPKHLTSLDHIRAKIYGHALAEDQIHEIIQDLIAGYLSDIHISAFLAASGNGHFSEKEIFYLTKAMIAAGSQLSWPSDLVVDKHCVGGLPGNRTTLIVVPIVAAFGLTMPKTSSRAITSAAGTADTMEVLAPVNLSLTTMQKVVEKENACIVWGGAVTLSPADDILIRIERALMLDSESQLVASILSKKIAAGSSHILIDIPLGPTAKVRTQKAANLLKKYLTTIGKQLGVNVKVAFSDGSQPIGRGIGPALEATDVLAVLQNAPQAPLDLKEKSLMLAGEVIEFSPKVKKGKGFAIAEQILTSGQAWQKFQAICEAQGGLFSPPSAKFTHTVSAKRAGKITAIDNRYLTRIAKLAGAPTSKAAGVEILTPLGTHVTKDDPLFIIHSDTPGELNYAMDFLSLGRDIFAIEEAP